MSQLITLSRAARLVGVKRGALQSRIRAGELRTFEGEILLSDLLHAYPQTEVEDTTMLDRVGQIMEQAVNKVIHPYEVKADADTLAARILEMSQELAKARRESRRYSELIEKLKQKFAELVEEENTPSSAFSTLREWFDQALLSAEATESDTDSILAKEAFLRVMAAQVHVLPSGHEFLVEGSDSILEAGLRSGLALNYGCSNGNCGLCKAKLVSGQVKKISPHDYVMTGAEKALGYILTCSNTAVTDVVLEADEALSSSDIPHQEIELRIKKVEQPDDQIIILRAKTPRTKRLRFLAGQYLSLQADQLPEQDCSIASCPCDDMNLMFHIPKSSGETLPLYLINEVKANDIITVRGPCGDFTLNEESLRSLVFIACDAGIGPVKSLIEHAMALDVAEHLHLYWIVTEGNTHYLGNLCRSWADALDNFHYTALRAVNGKTVEDLLPGIIADLGNPSDIDFYVCLPGNLLEPVRTILLDIPLSVSQLRMEPVR